MSDRYMIRNCPAFVLMRTATSGTYFDMCGNAKGHIKCADCTDCVMKQIVELCGKYHIIDAGYQKVAINYLSSDILKLLDIQEVE